MAAANRFVPVGITVGRELAEVAERLRHCTVQVRGTDSGRGSGVIWRPDGLIVTNAHVATSSLHAVQLADGRIFQAELTRRDRRYDLAGLQIAASGLPSAQSRKASTLRTGELVLAVGNPLEVPGAFTVGVMAAAAKAGDAWVRADIRLAPGNSGGPLADANGLVVGINSMIVGGFGVAVSSAAVERFVSGGDRRIGVTVRPVGVYVESVPVLGLMVVELETGGPAHLSGVLIGDVIVRVDGKLLNSPEQLSDVIHATAHVLSIDVLRAGGLESCEVTVVRERVSEVA